MPPRLKGETMKLKHFLIASVLTTLAAMAVLTLAVPPTAEAKGPPATYFCRLCSEVDWSTGPVIRQVAVQLCAQGQQCVNKQGRFICNNPCYQ